MLMWFQNMICSNNQGGPTLDQRFESYYNYCNLFNYILSKFSMNVAECLSGTYFIVLYQKF